MAYWKNESLLAATAIAASGTQSTGEIKLHRPNGNSAEGSMTLWCKLAATSDRTAEIKYRLSPLGNVDTAANWTAYKTLVADYSAATDALGVSCDDDNWHPIDFSIPKAAKAEISIDNDGAETITATLYLDA